MWGMMHPPDKFSGNMFAPFPIGLIECRQEIGEEKNLQDGKHDKDF
jgi:hypothetical protein